MQSSKFGLPREAPKERRVVDQRGFEPLTTSMPWKCATIAPLAPVLWPKLRSYYTIISLRFKVEWIDIKEVGSWGLQPRRCDGFRSEGAVRWNDQ